MLARLVALDLIFRVEHPYKYYVTEWVGELLLRGCF